jgi:hypothetical protein
MELQFHKNLRAQKTFEYLIRYRSTTRNLMDTTFMLIISSNKTEKTYISLQLKYEDISVVVFSTKKKLVSV